MLSHTSEQYIGSLLHSQNRSGIQGLKVGMNIFTIAPKRANEFLLPVFVTLGSVCLNVPAAKGEMYPPGYIIMVPLNWKLRPSFDHFGLLMPLNQQAKKWVTVLAGMTNPNYQTGIEVLLYSKDKNYIWNFDQQSYSLEN